MKVIVKDEKCIGCGSCVSLTDEKIFDFNEEGKAYATVVFLRGQAGSFDEKFLYVKKIQNFHRTS